MRFQIPVNQQLLKHCDTFILQTKWTQTETLKKIEFSKQEGKLCYLDMISCKTLQLHAMVFNNITQ